jgi:hypothetical protein
VLGQGALLLYPFSFWKKMYLNLFAALSSDSFDKKALINLSL